jgi:hypothetical protein
MNEMRASTKRGKDILIDATNAPPGAYVKTNTGGTIVPKSLPTGGIEGNTPITVVKRKQVWDPETSNFKVEEVKDIDVLFKSGIIINDKSNDNNADNNSIVPADNEDIDTLLSAVEDSVVQAKETKPAKSKKSTKKAEQSLEDKLDAIKELIDRKMAIEPAKQEVVKKPNSTKIIVRYEGYFGTVEAVYNNVIVTSKCIALVRSTEIDTFYYSPPIDLEKEFRLYQFL